MVEANRLLDSPSLPQSSHVPIIKITSETHAPSTSVQLLQPSGKTPASFQGHLQMRWLRAYPI